MQHLPQAHPWMHLVMSEIINKWLFWIRKYCQVVSLKRENGYVLRKGLNFFFLLYYKLFLLLVIIEQKQAITRM